MRIASGVTDQYIYFVAVDSADFTTRETGFSSFTVYRSRNGGAAAAMTTPTINETDTTNMPGVYELLLDEDMTIDSGDDTQEMVFHITHAGMAPVTRTIELYRPKITAGNTLGVASDGDISGNLDGTVATVTTLTGHTAQTGDSFARLGAPTGASVSADIATAQADLDTITGSDGVTLATAQALYAPSKAGDAMGLTAGAVDAIWDEALTTSAHNGVDSAGRFLRQVDRATVITEGTADAGGTNTIDLETGVASTTNDIYNGDRIVIIDGTGAGEHGIVIDYEGVTNQRCTMAENWVVQPDNTSEYVIVPADCDVESWQHGVVTLSATTTLPEVDAKSISDNAAAADNVQANIGNLDATVSSRLASADINLTGGAVDTVTSVTNQVTADVTAISGSTTAADNLEGSALGIITGATSGTPSTTQTDTNLSGYADDELIGRVIVFTGGTANGQAATITDYASTNGVVSFAAITTAPAASDTFVIV